VVCCGSLTRWLHVSARLSGGCVRNYVMRKFNYLPDIDRHGALPVKHAHRNLSLPPSNQSFASMCRFSSRINKIRGPLHDSTRAVVMRDYLLRNIRLTIRNVVSPILHASK
jgi:hypothetical protein